jgi:hypothetical protein
LQLGRAIEDNSNFQVIRNHLAVGISKANTDENDKSVVVDCGNNTQFVALKGILLNSVLDAVRLMLF